MRPIEMVDAGIRALRSAEVGTLSWETAASVAMAWAALAAATVPAIEFEENRHPPQAA
jgi:hypothetical protein